jgi:hypothetical protein
VLTKLSAVNPHHDQNTLAVLLLVDVILCVPSCMAARHWGKV